MLGCLGCWPPVAPCKASLMPQVEAWRAAKSERKAEAKKKHYIKALMRLYTTIYDYIRLYTTIYDYIRLCFVCVAILQSMFSVLTCLNSYHDHIDLIGFHWTPFGLANFQIYGFLTLGKRWVSEVSDISRKSRADWGSAWHRSPTLIENELTVSMKYIIYIYIL